MPANNIGVASPVTRFLAYVLDNIYTFTATMILVTLTARNAGGADAFLTLIGLLGTAHTLVGLYFWSQGTSPGKRTLGLYVYSTQSGQRLGFFTMLFRELIGKWISAVFFGLGYIWILFDPHRQGWHDKLVNSIVLKGTDGL